MLSPTIYKLRIFLSLHFCWHIQLFSRWVPYRYFPFENIPVRSNIADGKQFFLIVHSFFLVHVSFYFSSFIVFGKFYFFSRRHFLQFRHIEMQRDINGGPKKIGDSHFMFYTHLFRNTFSPTN